MTLVKCPECGQMFDKNLNACPNCGCPASECETIIIAEANNAPTNVSSQPCPQKPYIFEVDWAHKFYQCSVLYWETFTNRFFKFSGRASRLEYWNFFIFLFLIPMLIAFITSLKEHGLDSQKPITFEPDPLFILLGMIPYVAVSFRRLHDINEPGWWFFVPFVAFFLSFKKSDEGVNTYGLPSNISLENPNADGESAHKWGKLVLVLVAIGVAIFYLILYISML